MREPLLEWEPAKAVQVVHLLLQFEDMVVTKAQLELQETNLRHSGLKHHFSLVFFGLPLQPGNLALLVHRN